MKLNVERSRALCEKVHGQDKECFLNAFRGLGTVPGAVYVEGWIVAPVLPFPTEHGWLEVEGEILDPTPCRLGEGQEARYFAGVRYTLAEAVRAGDTIGVVPFVYGKQGITGMHVESHRDAYIEAARAAMGDQAEQFLAMHPWYRELQSPQFITHGTRE